MGKMVIDIFKLGARGSWRIPAEMFLRSSTGTQVSDAVKSNMADRVQFLNLAGGRCVEGGGGGAKMPCCIKV